MAVPRLLIAEDEDSLRRLLGMLLSNEGYKITLVADGAEARQHLEKHRFDLLITDLKMPRLDGMALVKLVREKWSDLPVIVITGHGTIESAVEAMQLGAIDFITKPFEEEKLKLSVKRGLRIQKLLAENRQLRSEVAGLWGLDNIITQSPLMKEAIGMARRVAASNANVIVYGESGTGKELITRGIHNAGVRAGKPFVAINCAAIPDNLLESELFGFERGAFTGATERKIGKFELADGGTLFLDEIADLSANVQAKVLRAIENREIQRVGGTELIRVDIRFIAATNKILRDEVTAGKFREDLFFRLNVFPIYLPPLRERPEDVVPLVDHFLSVFCAQMGKRKPKLSREALDRLTADPWQGNVRELQNTIERAVILLQGDTLSPDHIRKLEGSELKSVAAAAPADRFVLPKEGFSLEEHEKVLIRQALERSGHKKAAAARLLGLTRATLRYRLEKYGIDDADDADEVKAAGERSGALKRGA